MKKHEVIIIGGGPAGLWCSYLLAKEGFQVILLERKSEIGTPVQCAGLVSEDVIKITGAKDSLIETLREVEVIGKEEKILISSKIKACSIDRRKFDQELAEIASSEGVKIEIHSPAFSVARGKVKIRGDELSGENIIIAEGASSYLTRKVGIGGPKELIVGLEMLSKTKDDHLKIFLRKDLFPDFFGWEVPKGELSLIGGASHRISLEKVRKLKEICGGKGEFGIYSGPIPLGPVKRPQLGQIYSLGDCAGQVKATTGGGIYMDLKFSEALRDEIISESTGNYAKRAKKEYKEIFTDYVIYKWYSSLSQESLDEILRFLRDNEDLLKRHWKYDYHSKTVIPLFLFSKGKRKIAKEGFSLLLHLIRSFF